MMKTSEFLEGVLRHLGAPEAWCQNAMFRRGRIGAGYTGPLTSASLATQPEEVTSACLEGAIQLTAAEHWAELLGHRVTPSDILGSTQIQVDLIPVRRALQATMVEQFPEVVEMAKEEARKDIEEADALGGPLFSDQDLRRRRIISGEEPPTIPQFNDHPSMTYEGVRSTIEKTIASCREAGD